MKIAKLLRVCVASLCLMAFVAGNIGCTNEPAKGPKKPDAKETKAKPSSNTT